MVHTRIKKYCGQQLHGNVGGGGKELEPLCLNLKWHVTMTQHVWKLVLFLCKHNQSQYHTIIYQAIEPLTFP